MEQKSKRACDSIPYGFVSAEYELPCEDGTYEVLALAVREGRPVCCVIEAEYRTELGGFVPMPGMSCAPPWRYSLPDEADLAEFRARGGDAVLWI